MRNPEKSALRKQFRRARAQMSADERNTATETINRLLKPYIKKGRKIGVYWPMGKELRLDGFVRAAQKRGAKLYLPYIEPHTRRMSVHPLPCRRRQTRTQTRPRQIARPPIHRQKNPRPPTQPIAGPHRRHRQTRLPPRTGRWLLRRHPLRHEIPPANPNPGRRLRLPTDRHPADRTPRHPPKRLCLRAWRIEIQTASIGQLSVY